jgi:hypothetical protein
MLAIVDELLKERLLPNARLKITLSLSFAIAPLLNDVLSFDPSLAILRTEIDDERFKKPTNDSLHWPHIYLERTLNELPKEQLL